MKDGKFFGRPLRTEIGVTQGDPFSLKIFNIVVYEVVRAGLLEVFGPQESHHRFGWAAGEHNIVFYADNGKTAMSNPIWLQTTLKDMVSIFERVELQTNLGNTKAMVCTPGFIWVQQGNEVYKRRATGEGANFGSERESGQVLWSAGRQWRRSPSVTPWIVHTEYSCNITGCRRWQRRTKDIQGVFYVGTEVGGVPGRRMPSKGKQPRES